MPEGGSEVRGAQQATLQGVLHERWTSPRLGSLLNELGEKVERSPFTGADRGLVRQARCGYDRATKLPRALVKEMARVSSASFDAWRRAKSQNDFASFAPWLNRMVALQREVADHLSYAETRYDDLLDEYEPGLTASRLDKLFGPVREVSTTLLRRIEASGSTVDASCLGGHFPVEQQVVLCKSILRGMGYDFSRGNIAQSPNNSALMGAAPREQQGSASGFLATGRVVGQSVSVALAGAIFTSLGGAAAGSILALQGRTLSAAQMSALQQAFAYAFHITCIVCASIAAIGVFTSLVRGKGK